MKRLFTFILATVLGTTALMAQNKQTFEFVDAKGKVIPNGSTVTFNKVEELVPGVPGAGLIMPADVSVRNISGNAQKVILVGTVKNMKEGVLQVCFPAGCKRWKKVGSYTSEAGDLSAKKTDLTSLEMEFSLAEQATNQANCTVQVQLYTAKKAGNDWVTDKPGPKITIVFDKTATGINTVSTEGPVTYTVYTLQGKLVGKGISSLQGLAKGTYIIQKKDNKGVVSAEKHIIQ